MTPQRKALEWVIERCCEADPGCGIVLQGSVARGEERPDSDVDVTVVTRTSPPAAFNEFIARGNHVSMTRVRLESPGVDVDVNWLSVDELLGLVKTRGAADWWMFHRGTPVHDPAGLVRRCRKAIADWFDRNPSVAEAWGRQQAEVEKHKKDPTQTLRFPAQPEFCAHLRASRSRRKGDR